jgi:hypothetical protein
MLRSYNVMVERSARPELDAIVEQIRALGMRVSGIGARLGMVTGSMEESLVPKIRAVRGVRLVTPDREAQLAEE